MANNDNPNPNPSALERSIEPAAAMAANNNPNPGAAALDRWARTVAGEIQRHQSLRPLAGGRRRRLRFTPRPPEATAEVHRTMGVWPPKEGSRDKMASVMAWEMTGLVGSFARVHGGAVPESEANRAANAVEAGAFAAAEAFAAGKDLSTGAARFEVFQTYERELLARAIRYAKSRQSRRRGAAAAGTSSAAGAGPAADLPPHHPLSPSVTGFGHVQQLQLLLSTYYPLQQEQPPPAAAAPEASRE